MRQPVFDVFDHHDRAVHKEANRNGKAAERHDVGGVAERTQTPKVISVASGRMTETTSAARRLPRNSTSSTMHQHHRFDQHFLHGEYGFADQVAAVVKQHDLGLFGQPRF